MRIGFDAKRLFLNQTGLGNYSRDVVKDLAFFYPNNNYHLFTTNNPKTSRTEFTFSADFTTHLPTGICSGIAKSYWRSFRLENDLLKNNIDIFHGLSGEIPKRKEFKKLKYVVTIHDLIFERYPEYYKPIDRKIYRKKFKYAAENSDAVIAISNQTKQDLINFYSIPEEKIKVIYQSCHEVFKQSYPQEKIKSFKQEQGLPGNYLLNVGTIESRKNLEVIIKALPKVDFPLVVLGKKTKYYTEVILPLIKKLDLENRISFLENIPLEELPLLYQGADCFIYPSKFEGFGIPVLEALYSKTPVVTSNSSSLKEVGKHSFLFDYENENELADLINNKLSDYNIENAYAFAQTFSSQNQAQQIHSIYESL